jgi:hypothetical protein
LRLSAVGSWADDGIIRPKEIMYPAKTPGPRRSAGIGLVTFPEFLASWRESRSSLQRVYEKKMAIKASEMSLRGGRRPTKQSQRSAQRLLRFARNDIQGCHNSVVHSLQIGDFGLKGQVKTEPIGAGVRRRAGTPALRGRTKPIARWATGGGEQAEGIRAGGARARLLGAGKMPATRMAGPSCRTKPIRPRGGIAD